MSPNDMVETLALGFIVAATLAVGFAVLWLRTREKLIRLEGAALTRTFADDARLERMERTIESVAIEIERLGEADRFAAQILAGRTLGGSDSAGTGRIITPH